MEQSQAESPQPGPAPSVDKRQAGIRYRLAIVALLATATGSLYGFLLDGSIRADPFDPNPGLWSWLTSGQPHSALRTMPVVPIGNRGTLTPRPVQTAWINSSRFPSLDGGIVFVDPTAAPASDNSSIQTDQTAQTTAVQEQSQAQSGLRSVPTTAGLDGPMMEAYCLPGGSHCWAVGTFGTALRSVKGGETWTQFTTNTDNDLRSVFFVTADRGWVVGDNGTILATETGGQSWVRQNSGTDDLLSSVTFYSSRVGWAAGLNSILSTTDGGTTWIPRVAASESLLSAVTFISPLQGWAAGLNGTVLSTLDGGRAWALQDSGTEEALSAISFVSPQRGWAVGLGGTILSTLDGGATWAGQVSGTRRNLLSVHFQDEQIGWATSDWGDDDGRPIVLQTLDGGGSWETLSYRHLPAPWVLYLALPGLFLSLYGVVITYRPAHRRSDEEGIATTGRADRPIGWHDRDVLGLKHIALGISRFLRNTRTEPPLTIAVTGRWGTGKSSLMNLIAEDLKRYGTSAIWFNAWHHQNEDHLLAALLENIRAQAVPPLWRLSGIVFRTRLAFGRLKRSLAGIAILVGAVVSAWLIARSQFVELSLPFDLDVAKIANSALYVATGGLMAQLGRLRLKPAQLMATLSTKARVRQFTEQLGFRHHFAREFGDVCDALRYGSNPGLVIFIDDLDRCRSKKVLQVLESVNFLATAGRCFIFLGIDEEKVISSVADSFEGSVLVLPKDASDEKKADTVESDEGSLGNDTPRLDGNGGPSMPAEPKRDGRKLAEFADHYLEKLINISVPVPEATVATSAALFGTDVGEETSPWPDRVRRMIRAAPDVGGPAVIIAAACAMILLANPTATTSADAENGQVGTDGGSVGEGTAATRTDSDVGSAEVERTAQAPAVVSASALGPNLVGRLTVPFAAAGLLAGLVLLRRSSRSVSGKISDSADFASALNIWHSTFFATNPTPRGVKRHHNRLRLYAMRLRPQERPSDWIDQIFGAEPVSSADTANGRDAGVTISEEKIVALGALQALDPGLLQLEPTEIKSAFEDRATDAWASAESEVDANGRGQAMFPKPWEAFDRFEEHFGGQWPPTADELESFRALTRSVRA